MDSACIAPRIAQSAMGGARLRLTPGADLGAVINLGEYDLPMAWITLGRVWSEIILAKLQHS